MEEDPIEVAVAAVKAADKWQQEAEMDVVRSIAAARNAGVTWQAIADALGKKQPNIVRKYGPLLEETREVRVRVVE